METIFEIGSCSDVGRRRQENQDCFDEFDTAYGHVLVVCDGMGGHTGGGTASRLAVDKIRSYFEHVDPDIGERQALLASIELANQSIINYTAQYPDFKGMGTTVVLLLLKNGQAFYAHAGDSRMYFIRGGQIYQQTKDHSLVQKLVDSGTVAPENAENHPQKNVLIKALGDKDIVNPEVAEPITLFDGDIFLLCTDGLSNMVKNNDLFTISQENDARTACKKLVDLANENGGKDNITVLIAKISTDKEMSPRGRENRNTLKLTSLKKNINKRNIIAASVAMLLAVYLLYLLISRLSAPDTSQKGPASNAIDSKKDSVSVYAPKQPDKKPDTEPAQESKPTGSVTQDDTKKQPAAASQETKKPDAKKTEKKHEKTQKEGSRNDDNTEPQ